MLICLHIRQVTTQIVRKDDDDIMSVVNILMSCRPLLAVSECIFVDFGIYVTLVFR